MKVRLYRAIYRLIVVLCLVAVVVLLTKYVHYQCARDPTQETHPRRVDVTPSLASELENNGRVVDSVVAMATANGSRELAEEAESSMPVVEGSLGSESRHDQSTLPSATTHQPGDESSSPTSSQAPVSLGPPVSQPRGCKEMNCKEFLSDKEIFAMKKCENEVRKYPGTPLEGGNCSFMNGQGRMPVALASSEGSGNTWIRGLLERVTGICTGFIYCDYVMRSRGFIGEAIKSGSVSVVKTHTIGPQWHGVQYQKRIQMAETLYGSAIFVIRNPFDSLIAEWNRWATNTILIKKHLPHNESHTNVIPKTLFSGAEWEQFFQRYVKDWKTRLLNWVIQETDHPVHVVRYEDLKRDTLEVLKSLLDFVKIPYEEEDMAVRLKEDFDMFRRKHDGRLDPYPAEKKAVIRKMLLEVIELAEARNLNDKLQLHQYLPWPSEVS